ncbi:MAG: hypothetical protein DDT18_00318 [Actinobacteria bacterium]|nr:hypothetical protein [Actinomycetota bacterium]
MRRIKTTELALGTSSNSAPCKGKAPILIKSPSITRKAAARRAGLPSPSEIAISLKVAWLVSPKRKEKPKAIRREEKIPRSKNLVEASPRLFCPPMAKRYPGPAISSRARKRETRWELVKRTKTPTIRRVRRIRRYPKSSSLLRAVITRTRIKLIPRNTPTERRMTVGGSMVSRPFRVLP